MATERRLSTAYANRKSDLSVVRKVIPSSTVPEVIDFANPAEVVAGPQKATQNWMTAFLTRKGTAAGEPDYGTNFLGDLLANRYRDDMAVEQGFALAVMDVLAYDRQTADTGRPDDEVVTAAALLPGWDYDRPNGRLVLRVGLTLRDGNVSDVLLPVPLNLS